MIINYYYNTQIRCKNHYGLWSNWSDPAVLRKYPDEDPECRGILPQTTSSTSSTTISTKLPSSNSGEDKFYVT